MDDKHRIAPAGSVLPPIDARAILDIIDTNWVRWGWDERYFKVVRGRLSRGNPKIAPLDETAASVIISMSREGRGLVHALKLTGITQRRFFAWLAQSTSRAAEDEPYREFRRQLTAAVDEMETRTGRADEKGRRYFLCSSDISP